MRLKKTKRILNQLLDIRKEEIVGILNWRKNWRRTRDIKKIGREFREAAKQELFLYARKKFYELKKRSKKTFFVKKKQSLEDQIRTWKKKNGFKRLVYIYWGKSGRSGRKRCLYVGKTGGKGNRITQHT